MKYTKPPLAFEQQADLLLSRGMQGDRATMMDRLAVVNYYRLSGYPYSPRGSMRTGANWGDCPMWNQPEEPDHG
jgi:abortive infection bacteriophage resistance protein